MPYPFVPGWSKELSYRGRARFHARGRAFFAGAQFAGDTRPLPQGFSLSGWIKTSYDQGPIGSCFANMAAYILQIMMYAAVANGAAGKAFNPSRRLAWYQCRKLDGSLGSGEDGGSIVNSFAALGPAPDGVGDCTEEEWPYKPDHRWLEMKPPAEVITDAGSTRLVQIAEMKFDPTSWKRSIFNCHPIGIGIDWPEGWDDHVDLTGRAQGIGRRVGGHAITVIGWLENWDGHTWWQIVNSHGPIYHPVPADVQKRITGYVPDGLTDGRCYSWWVREDWLQQVLGEKWAEANNAASVTGFLPLPKNVPDFTQAFIV